VILIFLINLFLSVQRLLYSNAGAKSEMKRLLEYFFIEKSEEKDPIENFSEIT